jgi:hypothetical protein
MTTYYVYSVDPIDLGWHRLHVMVDDLPEAIASAAKTIGWEGDVRGRHIGWHPMPSETCFLPCFVWKHDTNGTTFIASPIAIQFPGRVFESTKVDVPSNAVSGFTD